MSRDRLDMTGLWHGTFVYPAFAGPTTPFVANIVETDGRLAGTTMEPNLISGLPGEEGELEAAIAGTRQARAVDFIKTYDGKVVDNSVDYVGQLSGDGRTVTGVWSYEAWDGTFEMHRDAVLEEAVAEEVAEEVPVPVAVPAVG